jgi:hypothetical protein
MHRKHSLLLAFALLLLITPLALAQGNVTVFGTVRDTTGAVINGAEVRIEGAAVGFNRSVVTATDGQYQIIDVPPGTYQVTVTATNFSPAVATVTITSDAKQNIDLGLEVGATQATVSVETDAEVTQKEDSIVGGVIDSRRVQDLPLNTRQPYNFVLLQPGAVAAPPQYSNRIDHYSEVSALQDGRAVPLTLTGLRDVPAVNGNRPEQSNYMMDGVDNNNQNVAGFNTNVSPDSVQELRIATHNASAEFGRNSGLIANIQTKAGSTEFHGSLFEFFNNDVLNANSFFAGLVQPGTQLFDEDNRDRIRRNQFGGAIGGPITKKVFFFGSAEFGRERSSLINTVNVPTRAYLDTLPFLVPQRTLLGLFQGPEPSFGFLDQNGDGVAESGVGVAAIYRSINRNMATFRTDFVVSNTNRITFRFAYDDRDEDSLQGQIPGAGFGYQGFNTKIGSRGQNYLFQDVYTPSPNFYNDFTFGYNRFNFSAFQPIAFDAPLILVQPNVPITEGRKVDLQVPEIEDLTSGVSLPGLRSDLPLKTTEGTFQFRDTVSYTTGDHHIKGGVEYRRYLNPSFFQAFSAGKFTFQGLSGGPNSFNTGSPLYTQFLVDPFNGGPVDTYRTFRRNEGFAFLQDDIKVTKNFTLNLGLRYEYYGVVSSKDPNDFNLDANYFIDASRSDFLANVGNGSFAPIERLYDRDTNNFAPRIGFAFDLFGNAKTVVRASYGIFYSRPMNQLINNVRFNPPFAAIGLFTGGPINSFNTPLDRSEVALSTFQPNAFPVATRLRTPYVQEWFLGVQQDVGANTVVEVNYIGNTGRSLVVTDDVNRFNGSALDPLTGQPNVQKDPRPNQSVARAFLTETAGKSFYHSLQFSVNRRFSNGLQFNFAYNYSHSIDEVSDPFRAINGGGFLQSEALAGPMQVRNYGLDRGSSDFDVRHRGIFNINYELPFLRGSALGGWQIASIVTLQSGQPFTIFGTNDSNADLIFNDRAVFVGDSQDAARIEKVKENGLQYLRPGFFTLTSDINNSGAMGRNLFTGPSFHSVDFSLIKNTKIGEDVNVQLRAEAFNLFNKTNFANPNGNLSNPATFGLVTKAYNPRMVQLAIRLQF